MNIGNKIKDARKLAGLTQKELAKKCEVAEITIRQYETDKRQPRYEQLLKIADALGIETKDLLPETDYNRVLGDKAFAAYSMVLEQVIGLKGYTFGITEDDDSLYISYPDGILKVSNSIVDKLQEDIESYTEFSLQELKKNYRENFIPNNQFDYVRRVSKKKHENSSIE